MLFRLYKSSGDPLVKDIRYALTNQRVLFIEPVRRFSAYNLCDVTPEIGQANSDGSGSILLKGPELSIRNYVESIPQEVLSLFSDSEIDAINNARFSPMFKDIPDVHAVCDLITRLKKEQPAS